MLARTCKRDRGGYEFLPGIWSQWILEGVVENDNIPSMRNLAHIYDDIKDTSSEGSTGEVMPARAAIAFKHNARFERLSENIYPKQLAARGRRQMSQPRSARRKM